MPMAFPQGSPRPGEEKARKQTQRAYPKVSVSRAQGMLGDAGPPALKQAAGCRDRHRPGVRKRRKATPSPLQYLVSRPVVFWKTLQRKQQK